MFAPPVWGGGLAVIGPRPCVTAAAKSNRYILIGPPNVGRYVPDPSSRFENAAAVAAAAPRSGAATINCHSMAAPSAPALPPLTSAPKPDVTIKLALCRDPSDIIVIGAGVIGWAVAYELTRRGASVQVIDDRPPGMGATQASAGMLAPFTEAKDRDEAFLDLAVRSLDLFDAFVARVTETSDMPVGYRRTGTMDVASTAERMASLRDIAGRLKARGVAAWHCSMRTPRARRSRSLATPSPARC